MLYLLARKSLFKLDNMLSQVSASTSTSTSKQKQAAKSALLGRKNDETAAGLQKAIAKQLHLINGDNATIIVEYVTALKSEVSLANTTADERVRLQALALIDQCNSHKMDLITNGAVVSDALKYVNGKAEKLSAAAAKMSTNDEDGKEDYETTMTSETEETTNKSSSDA